MSNVIFKLYSCTASTIQNTLCKCSWSDAIVSKVISGFRQKWRKVTASCGGLLWKMEVDEKVHEDALIWDLKVIKRAPINDNNIMVPFVEVWSNKRRSPCQLCLCQTDDWTAGNGFQTNILAHWSEPTLDLTPCMPDFISKLIIGIFGWKFIDFHVDLLLSSICPPKCLISYQNDKLE